MHLVFAGGELAFGMFVLDRLFSILISDHFAVEIHIVPKSGAPGSFSYLGLFIDLESCCRWSCVPQR